MRKKKPYVKNLLLEFQVNEEEFENEREKKNARYFLRNREITATGRKRRRRRKNQRRKSDTKHSH